MQIRVGVLKGIIFERGIPQWKLAQSIGLSETYLSMIFRRKVEPSEQLVIKIAKALQVDSSLLINPDSGKHVVHHDILLSPPASHARQRPAGICRQRNKSGKKK